MKETEKIAVAYGIPYYKLETLGDIENNLSKIINKQFIIKKKNN